MGVHRPPGAKAEQAVGLSRLSVRPEGLEPPTPGSEDRYSIQLSYGRLRASSKRGGVSFHETPAGSPLRFGFPRLRCDSSPEREVFKEERRDSNPQPPGPQPGALTDCATLPMCVLVRPGGFEPPASGLEGRCSVH